MVKKGLAHKGADRQTLNDEFRQITWKVATEMIKALRTMPEGLLAESRILNWTSCSIFDYMSVCVLVFQKFDDRHNLFLDPSAYVKIITDEQPVLREGQAELPITHPP